MHEWLNEPNNLLSKNRLRMLTQLLRSWLYISFYGQETRCEVSIVDFYLNNEEALCYLSKKVESACSQLNEGIQVTRCFAEFAHTFSKIFYLYSKHRVDRLRRNEIEVLTETYSNLYFPELTHLTLKEYESYFTTQRVVLLEQIKHKSACVLDYGSGISYVPMVKGINFLCYTGFDNNLDICRFNVFLYEYLCDKVDTFRLNDKRVEFTSKFSMCRQYDCILAFNVLKFIVENDLNRTLALLLSQGKNVIVLDSNSVLQRIINYSILHNINYVQLEHDYLVLRLSKDEI